MEGPFGGRAQKRRPSINIAPLIDVMFLLLIFFMVSSTFREHVGVDIRLPEAQTATEQEKGDWKVFVKREGVFNFEDTDLDSAALRERLAALIEAEPDAVLVIDADRAAPFQAVVQAMDIAREVGGQSLIISTESVAAAPAP